MAGKGKQNEIVFVNSFKGGAGKTTLALTHCIDDLFHEHRFENVIYIDLDILGTATSYLFDKDKLLSEKCFNNTQKAVEVTLTYEGESRVLYVAYLSPELKARSVYGGQNFVNHQDIAQQRLRDDILAYVRGIVEKRKGNLIVFDCAPGFSKMEQELLKECYDMKFERKIEVREEYVTTLDFGHIEKCIQCVRNSWEVFRTPPKFRNIRMTLNDMQNFHRYVSEYLGDNAEQKIKEIAEEVWGRLQEEDMPNLEIYFWQYSQNIAMRSIFKHRQVVENQVDSYIMTADSYRAYRPI